MSYDSYASSRLEHIFFATSSPLDATGTAATGSLGKFAIPYISSYGTKFQVIEWGYVNAVAATLTTAAVLKLQSVTTGGVATDVGSSTITATATAAGSQENSGDLNQTTSSGAYGSSKYSAIPSYTEVDLSIDSYLHIYVTTQGVGTHSIVPWVRGRYV